MIYPQRALNEVSTALLDVCFPLPSLSFAFYEFQKSVVYVGKPDISVARTEKSAALSFLCLELFGMAMSQVEQFLVQVSSQDTRKRHPWYFHVTNLQKRGISEWLGSPRSTLHCERVLLVKRLLPIATGMFAREFPLSYIF